MKRHLLLLILMPPLMTFWVITTWCYNTLSKHTSNWAILVNTSRFWFNYRHATNMFLVYSILKHSGAFPDSHILLLSADDFACNTRNTHPGTLFDEAQRWCEDQQPVKRPRGACNVYGEDGNVVEPMRWRGEEVNVDGFVKLLSGRTGTQVPMARRLLSDPHSNVVIYMTGHGGDGFFKFQDHEELGSFEMAELLDQLGPLEGKTRFNELLLMVDTCQASTMYECVTVPNVLAMASSVKGQSSYSHAVDKYLGVAVIDKFANGLKAFFDGIDLESSTATITDLHAFLDFKRIASNVDLRSDLMKRPLDQILVKDFFLFRQSYSVTTENDQEKETNDRPITFEQVEKRKLRPVSVVNGRLDTKVNSPFSTGSIRVVFQLDLFKMV